MAVSKLPAPRRISRNRISAEKPPEGRAQTPRYPQVSRRRGGMVARCRRGKKERWRGTERGESGGKARSGGRALDFIKRAGRRAPKLAHARLLFPACARSFPDVSAISTLFSIVIFILYLIFNIYLYFLYCLLFSLLFFLQYRSSDLYLTDRKETNGNFAKRYPYPSPDLQIRSSLVHPFLPQDKLLIQMHLDACNAWASC